LEWEWEWKKGVRRVLMWRGCRRREGRRERRSNAKRRGRKG
jgi:hypothetical protein